MSTITGITSSATDWSAYKGASITNIHRGPKDKGRDIFVYAEIRAKDGTLLVSASLSYCTERMVEASRHF